MINTEQVTFSFGEGFSKNEMQDIQRCLAFLYSTRAGTQALDREFGLDGEFLSRENELAKSAFTIEVISKTDIYEPRAKVTEVDFVTDLDSGALYPVIKLEKGDEGNEF